MRDPYPDLDMDLPFATELVAVSKRLGLEMEAEGVLGDNGGAFRPIMDDEAP